MDWTAMQFDYRARQTRRARLTIIAALAGATALAAGILFKGSGLPHTTR
jgi:hypothetical protein